MIQRLKLIVVSFICYIIAPSISELFLPFFHVLNSLLCIFFVAATKVKFLPDSSFYHSLCSQDFL
tara:strand:+ start:3526 stop:3720 length:195 start_codon:yes stop_codon:yes gene_type:complete